MAGIKYYYLDEQKNAVECSLEEWAEKSDHGIRHVADDTINPHVRVSTIFLGMDCNALFQSERPEIFETMIFGGPNDEYQERSSTYREAEEAHRRAVQLAAQVQMILDPIGKSYEDGRKAGRLEALHKIHEMTYQDTSCQNILFQIGKYYGSLMKEQAAEYAANKKAD